MESDNIKYVSQLSANVKDILKDGLEEHEIIPLVFSLMKLVDKFTELKGEQKKSIVLETLNGYIEENIQDENKKEFIKKVVNVVVPQAINVLAKVNKRKLRSFVKKVMSSCKK
jgi:hypothetical protein